MFDGVAYVEGLIGPDTVNTLPPATLDAFRDHGRPRPSPTENVEEANSTMETLAKLGISMHDVTAQLLDGLHRVRQHGYSNCNHPLVTAIIVNCLEYSVSKRAQAGARASGRLLTLTGHTIAKSDARSKSAGTSTLW